MSLGPTSQLSKAAVELALLEGGNEVCFFNADPIFVHIFLILDSKSMTNFGP